MAKHRSNVAEPDLSLNPTISSPSTPSVAEPMALKKTSQTMTPTKPNKNSYKSDDNDIPDTPPDETGSTKRIPATCSRSLSVNSFSKRPARSMPSLTRPLQEINSNTSKSPKPVKACASRAVSECSALSSSPISRFQAVRAAYQPTTVILSAATSNSASQLTTKAHFTSSNSSSSSFKSSHKLFSPFVKTSTSTPERLILASTTTEPYRTPSCSVATATCSTDTDIDNTGFDSSSPVSSNTKSTHKTSDDQESAKSSIPLLPIAANPDPHFNSTSINETQKESPTNLLGEECHTPKKSFLQTPIETRQQRIGSNSKSKSSPFLVTENQIDFDLPHHIMSQSTPQSSPVKPRPINTPTNAPSSSLLTTTPPALMFSAKKSLASLGPSCNSNSPFLRTPNRSFFSPNFMSRAATTMTQPYTPFSQSKTIVSPDEDLSISGTTPLNHASFAQRNKLDLLKFGERNKIDLRISSKEDEDFSDNDTTQATIKRKFVSNSTVTSTKNKQSKTGNLDKNRNLKGIIKDTGYAHFDTRQNVVRHKTVRFDSSLLESRVFHDDCFSDSNDDENDPEYDSEEEEEEDYVAQKQSNLAAQFERDFDSNSEDEEDKEETGNRTSNTLKVLPDSLDSEMHDPDSSMAPIPSSTDLESENGDMTVGHIEKDQVNGSDDVEKDSVQSSTFATINYQENYDSDEYESETEGDHTKVLDLDELDPDYEGSESDFSYASDFYDEYDEEEEAYMRQDMLDYPDGDIAHSNKLLNKKIDEKFLPPLQSHHQIRSAIQTNKFKNVIIDTIEDIQLQLESEEYGSGDDEEEEEEEDNLVNDGNCKRRRLFLNTLPSSRPKRSHVIQNCDKMLESYAKSMAGDFFKWVAQIQAKGGDEWANVLKRFTERKMQYEQEMQESATEENGMREMTPGPAEIAQNIEIGNTPNDKLVGSCVSGENESANPNEETEMLNQGHISVEMTDVPATGSEIASESIKSNSERKTNDSDMNVENQSLTKQREGLVEPGAQNSLIKLDSNAVIEPESESEKLNIDTFTMNDAADVLRQDLVRLFNEDSPSIPWITKIAFSRILSSIRRMSNEALESRSFLDNDTMANPRFISLPNKIRQHEEEDDQSLHSLIYKTGQGVTYGMQHHQHIPPYTSAQQPHPNQLGMATSYLGGLYGNVTSSPAMPQTHWHTMASRSRNTSGGHPMIVGYEHPTIAPPPTDPLSNFTSMRPTGQISGRKRIRSADNLYYQYYQHKNNNYTQSYDNDYNENSSRVAYSEMDQDQEADDVFDYGSNNLVSSQSIASQSEQEALITSFSSSKSSQETNGDGKEASNNDNDTSAHTQQQQQPALKRRRLKTASISNRTFVKSYLAENTFGNTAGITTDGSGPSLMPALPSLSFGPPLATSSFIDPVVDNSGNDGNNFVNNDTNNTGTIQKEAGQDSKFNDGDESMMKSDI